MTNIFTVRKCFNSKTEKDVKLYNICKSEYKKSILNNDIIFTNSFQRDALIDGIHISLRFKLCKYNEKYATSLFPVVLKNLNKAISNLDDSIKTLLKEQGTKIIYSDLESIKMFRGYNCVGYFNVSRNEIHIGLDTYKNSIKTLYHEIGHLIDYVIGEGDNFYSEMNKITDFGFELDASTLRPYASKNTKEYVAVAFEEYLYKNTSLNHILYTKFLVQHYLLSIKRKYTV